MQRAQRKAIKVSTNTITPTLVVIMEKEVREATNDIVLYIQNGMCNLHGDESKRWAMSKVFSTPSVSNMFPNIIDIQAFKSIKVQNEIVVGLVKSLEEVKRPCSAAKLITKHVLLIVVVSSNGQNTSFRQRAHALGVHHRNISYVVQWFDKGLWIVMVFFCGLCM